MFDAISVREHQIEYDTQQILKEVDEFYEIYNKRPIKHNDGGMKSPHLFNTWYVIKKLKPKLVIESGVWKGLGTWIIETAAPSTQIISIDIDYRNLIYKSPAATYLDRDIKSFDWKTMLTDYNVSPEQVFVFLDDHQNFLDRLEFLYQLGIKHVMYEDNYPPSQGNCLSPKKILSGQDYIIDERGHRQLNRYSYAHYDEFQRRVEHYQELPPIFKTTETRWHDEWEEKKYPTPQALLEHDFKEKYPLFYNEADSYTWICYMRLKSQQ